jgi:hypothetical protein
MGSREETRHAVLALMEWNHHWHCASRLKGREIQRERPRVVGSVAGGRLRNGYADRHGRFPV